MIVQQSNHKLQQHLKKFSVLYWDQQTAVLQGAHGCQLALEKKICQSKKDVSFWNVLKGFAVKINSFFSSKGN